jgi:hypothetical protein
MEINSGNLILYVDDKPIIACTGATFTLPENEPPILCEAVPEYNLTVSGKWPELTRLQALKFEWYCARRMSRKKKKSYRKKLEQAISYELYREQVDRFLSTIGPENG